MNPLQFLMQLDDERIVAAIRQAEKQTSGEIRVYVASQKHADPYAAAVEQFHKLGMTATRNRNGVLLFIAPRSQTFAIVGDEAIHEQCGGAFWSDVRDEMTRAFANGSPTEALIRGIHRVAQRLAEHFPRRADDQNELNDSVVRDK